VIADAAEQSAAVLVAWSFYSADFTRSSDLLYAVRSEIDPANVRHSPAACTPAQSRHAHRLPGGTWWPSARARPR
jgi:hypothetical protein